MRGYTVYDSPVGRLTLACGEDGKSLMGLWMDGQKYHGAERYPDLELWEDAPVFPQVRDWLDRYFAGKRPESGELPLKPEGTPFRRAVWRLLCQIPYGTLTTYGELGRRLAEEMGRPSMSGQAIGGAVGHNPIGIIIPCHRVVGAGGSLTGYAGGIETKIRLLELEGVDMAGLWIPKRGTAL